MRVTTRPVLPRLGLTHRISGISIEKNTEATVFVLLVMINGQRLFNIPEGFGDKQALVPEEVQTIVLLEKA